MTDIHISRNAVAIDRAYEWQPMKDCPRGVKLQLLGAGGVAVYGTYNGDQFWEGWAPVPSRPKETT